MTVAASSEARQDVATLYSLSKKNNAMLNEASCGRFRATTRNATLTVPEELACSARALAVRESGETVRCELVLVLVGRSSLSHTHCTHLLAV